MNARPRSGVGEIGGAHPHCSLAPRGEFPRLELWAPRALPASHPVNAAIALAAFGANQAVLAQVKWAHSVARMLREHAACVALSGERGLPRGPVRAAVTGVAELQDHYARQIAHTAQSVGRRYGHLAFAFPLAA